MLPFSAKRNDNSESVRTTRRGFFHATVSVLGGLGTCLACPSLWSSAIGKAADGDDEPKVCAVAQPGRLAFTVKPPIPFTNTSDISDVQKDHTIYLLDFAARQIAAAQGKTNVEAVDLAKAGLLEASGQFIDKTFIELEDNPNGNAALSMHFLFSGPEDASRRIRWTITFKDRSGAAIGSLTQVRSENRIAVRERNSRPGALRDGMLLINVTDNLSFDREWFSRTESLEVLFESI